MANITVEYKMRAAASIFILLLFAGTVSGQQVDYSSMTNAEFLGRLEQLRSPVRTATIEQGQPGERCGLGLTFEIIGRRTMMSGSEIAILEKLTAPPTYQKTIVSPSGRFKVRYDTADGDPDVPALLDMNGLPVSNTYNQYAQQIAEILDYVYDQEVNVYGYEAPPSPPYEVYLSDLGVGAYGATYPVGNALPGNTSAPRFNTYMAMDNDFRGYYRPGLDGARVTAAHEFHHMIQLGQYGSWGNADRYIYEMTSTHFEDVVYPDVNDYYQYLPDHFNQPHLPFYTPIGSLIGYQKAIFLQMLQKKYGPDVIRLSWENMKHADPANAINQALIVVSTDYTRELCNFGIWNYYTSYRASQRDATNRYDEAERFPDVKFAGVSQINGGKADFSETLLPYGSQYFRVYRGVDTVSFVVTNTDWSAAILTSTRDDRQSYMISVVDYQPGDPYIPLSNGWSYKFETPSANLLCLTAIVNEAAEESPIDVAYPNPFFPEHDVSIRFPMPSIVRQPKANLYIYSSSMSIVFKGDEQTIRTEDGYGRFMEWNGRSDDGEILPTGVYFYAIKFGDETKTGKFAVIRR